MDSIRISKLSRKVRATLYLPTDLLEEARDAAVFLAGYPVRLTLTRLAEDALRSELRRLKEEHNNGQAFPLAPPTYKAAAPSPHRDVPMQSMKPESSRSAELERLRRELLRRIVENENRRQATRRMLAK